MRDSAVFAQVKTLQGMRRTAQLSAGALEIHVRAVADRIGTLEVGTDADLARFGTALEGVADGQSVRVIPA